MKKLAIILWSALIISICPFGWPVVIALGIFLGVAYIYRFFKEESEIREWQKGGE